MNVFTHRFFTVGPAVRVRGELMRFPPSRARVYYDIKDVIINANECMREYFTHDGVYDSSPLFESMAERDVWLKTTNLLALPTQSPRKE